MKEIPLTQGKFATVDDADFERLSKHKWFARRDNAGKWYASRNSPRFIFGRKQINMHSEIMATPAGMLTDHIDGNGLNNRRSNLRICTASQNQMNKPPTRLNTSGYKGVSWSKSHGKWIAKIQSSGKSKYLGDFETAEEAARAYDKAAKEIHGVFSKTNF